MTEIKKHTCPFLVAEPPRYLYRHPCGRNATFFEEGKWWCSVHAPSKIAERDAKRTQRADVKWGKIEEDARRLAVFPKLLEAAEAVLGCRWVVETVSAEKDKLKKVVAEAKGGSE